MARIEARTPGTGPIQAAGLEDTVLGRESSSTKSDQRGGRLKRVVRRAGIPFALIATGTGLVTPSIIHAVDQGEPAGLNVEAGPGSTSPTTFRLDATVSPAAPKAVDQQAQPVVSARTDAAISPSNLASVTLPKDATTTITIKPGDTIWGLVTDGLKKTGVDPSTPTVNAGMHADIGLNPKIKDPDDLTIGQRLKVFTPKALKALSLLLKTKLPKDAPSVIQKLQQELQAANQYPAGTTVADSKVRHNDEALVGQAAQVVQDAQTFLQKEGISLTAAFTGKVPDGTTLAADVQTGAHGSVTLDALQVTSATQPAVEHPIIVNDTVSTPDSTPQIAPSSGSYTLVDYIGGPNITQFNTDLTSAEAVGIIVKDAKLGSNPTVWDQVEDTKTIVGRDLTVPETNIPVHIIIGTNPYGYKFNEMTEKTSYKGLSEPCILLLAAASHIQPDQLKELKGNIPSSAYDALVKIVGLNYRSSELSNYQVWKSDREAAASFLQVVNKIGPDLLKKYTLQIQEILKNPDKAMQLLQKFFNQADIQAALTAVYSGKLPNRNVLLSFKSIGKPSSLAVAA